MPDSQRPTRPEPCPGWQVAFVWTEYAMQWVVHFVGRSATAKVACGLVVLVLASTPVVYLVEAPARQRAREHLQWLVLGDAGSRPGGGGAVRLAAESSATAAGGAFRGAAGGASPKWGRASASGEEDAGTASRFCAGEAGAGPVPGAVSPARFAPASGVAISGPS